MVSKDKTNDQDKLQLSKDYKDQDELTSNENYADQSVQENTSEKELELDEQHTDQDELELNKSYIDGDKSLDEDGGYSRGNINKEDFLNENTKTSPWVSGGIFVLAGLSILAFLVFMFYGSNDSSTPSDDNKKDKSELKDSVEKEKVEAVDGDKKDGKEETKIEDFFKVKNDEKHLQVNIDIKSIEALQGFFERQMEQQRKVLIELFRQQAELSRQKAEIDMGQTKAVENNTIALNDLVNELKELKKELSASTGELKELSTLTGEPKKDSKWIDRMKDFFFSVSKD